MARKQDLPEDLSPAQSPGVRDGLLSNAGRLLHAAIPMLDGKDVPLKSTPAMLGNGGVGKSTALHERDAGYRIL